MGHLPLLSDIFFCLFLSVGAQKVKHHSHLSLSCYFTPLVIFNGLVLILVSKNCKRSYMLKQ
ncbi:MAG: hypothetical protein DRH26_12160 [Deltaproteobacteria bacterium]|nr:MAG: hypothetical protein DRH26_12160 [Deltaproteobacteria bacterium]